MSIFKAIKARFSPPSPVDSHFFYWKAAEKDWRWHLKAGNGEIIASGEGYTSKASVQRGIGAVQRAAAIADVVERVD